MEEVAGTPVGAHSPHRHPRLLEPRQGGGDVQHILGRGGNQSHRDVPQGGKVGTEGLVLQVPDAPHAAGDGQGQPPLLADRHGP